MSTLCHQLTSYQRVIMRLPIFPGSNLNGWIGQLKQKLPVQGHYYRLGAKACSQPIRIKYLQLAPKLVIIVKGVL